MSVAMPTYEDDALERLQIIRDTTRQTKAAKSGISAEVIDLRSVAPLDDGLVSTSVAKTGRLLAVDEDYRRHGLSGELAAAGLRDGFAQHVLGGLVLGPAFADHERQEAVIRQSPLKWTIVRPPHLLDKPRTGVYRHGFAPTDRDIKGQISRADVADFMLKQLTDDRYVHAAPGVSY